MPAHETDLLVIGSGFGALPPAMRMAEAGWRVMVMEKGPHVDRGTFRLTQDPRYLLRYLKGLSGDHLNVTFAEALGGGSGFYEMVSLRAPTRAFHQVDDAGLPLWPTGVTRASLDPWYDVAEEMLGVEQIAVAQVPRSGQVFALLMKHLGYSCDRARYAVRDCLGSGFCVSGCVFGRKQSLHMNYIPRAEAAGVAFHCDQEALRIEPLSPAATAWHRYAVHFHDRVRGTRYAVRARSVVIAGGTVGTAALLLASRPWLPALSRQLGHQLAFNGGARVAALLPESIPPGDMFAGRSHPGMISYEFLDSHGLTISAMKPLPLQVVTAARLALAGVHGATRWWGEDHVALMRMYRERVIVLISLGLTPPAGHLTLGADGRPRLSLRVTPALARHRQDARALLTSILERNGCRMIETTFVDQAGQPVGDHHFASAHHVGSARMGDDASRGVCDGEGAVFHYPGLYVSDGAAIPSSLAVNTSLTILANAERIAAAMVAGHAAEGRPRRQAKATR